MKNLFLQFALIILCTLCVVLPASAVNTVVVTGNVVTISDIDSDWVWTDSYPGYKKLPVSSIQFNGAAADDRCVINEGTAAGATLLDVTVETAYDQRYKLFGGARLQPVLDFSDGVYTAGSVVIFVFDLE